MLELLVLHVCHFPLQIMWKIYNINNYNFDFSHVSVLTKLIPYYGLFYISPQIAAVFIFLYLLMNIFNSLANNKMLVLIIHLYIYIIAYLHCLYIFIY